MKPEMLDALLLDRALGELSPEVTALLTAYLQQNPTEAARAATLSDTIDTARAALTVPGTPPRPLDLARLQCEHRAAHTANHRGQILRLAACLAIGIAAGWMLHPIKKNPVQAVSAAPMLPPRVDEPRTQFWSLEHFAPEAAKANRRKL